MSGDPGQAGRARSGKMSQAPDVNPERRCAPEVFMPTIQCTPDQMNEATMHALVAATMAIYFQRGGRVPIDNEKLAVALMFSTGAMADDNPFKAGVRTIIERVLVAVGNLP
jgi:hypothetical protein